MRIQRKKLTPTDIIVITLSFALVSMVAVDCEAQVLQSVAHNAGAGLPSVGILNWPDGNWHVRAVLLDNTSSPLGVLVPETTFSLTAMWPAIFVTMASTAPTTYFIRFYRSQSAFSVSDPNIEYNDVPCSGDICNAAAATSVSLANNLNGGWLTGSVVPVELMEFTIE